MKNMSDEHIWAMIAVVMVVALLGFIGIVNAPDWVLERDLLAKCAARGGEMVSPQRSMAGFRAGCYRITYIPVEVL